MGFRIIQLHYETMGKNAIIKEGIVLRRPKQEVDLGFVRIRSLFYTPVDIELSATLIHEYLIRDRRDGFKELQLIVSVDAKIENEEAVLLVIRFADLVQYSQKVEKLAGRYPGEGIWVLRPNDEITVIRGDLSEKFVALQFKNKIYLIKQYDEE